jgi:hypothetical protein
MSNLLDVVERVAEAFYKQQLKAVVASNNNSSRQQQPMRTTAAVSNDNNGERYSNDRHNTASAATTTTDNGSTTMINDSTTRIPQWIVRKASEQYRILATRVPVGSINENRTSSGSSIDSAERRAAALLEYCARHATPPPPPSKSNTKTLPTPTTTTTTQHLLSWSLLGAAIHVTKTSTLSQLQHQLVHFMSPTTTAATTKTSITNNPCSSNRGGEKRKSLRTRPLVHYQTSSSCATTAPWSSSSSSAVAAPEPHLLPTLVIRLSGHLLDPHRVLRQARQLWMDLHSYYDHHHPHASSSSNNNNNNTTVNANERRGHLYDLHRYATAYQAAILYHVAVVSADKSSSNTVGRGGGGCGANGSGGSSCGRPAPPPHKKVKATNRKFSKWNDEALHPDDGSGRTFIHHHDDDNDDESERATASTMTTTTVQRPLQLADLVEASTEFTYLELKQVLPRVQELASAIQVKGHDRGGRQQRQKPGDAAAQKQSSRKSGVTNRVADSHNTQRLGAKHPSDSAPAAATLTTNPSDANESPGRTSPNPQRFRDAKGRSNRDGGIDPNHSWVSPSLSFYDLKKELLTSARNQARQIDATLTDNEAMACAADAILRKHGILV